jgi:hypothetical protein
MFHLPPSGICLPDQRECRPHTPVRRELHDGQMTTSYGVGLRDQLPNKNNYGTPLPPLGAVRRLRGRRCDRGSFQGEIPCDCNRIGPARGIPGDDDREVVPLELGWLR